MNESTDTATETAPIELPPDVRLDDPEDVFNLARLYAHYRTLDESRKAKLANALQEMFPDTFDALLRFIQQGGGVTDTSTTTMSERSNDMGTIYLADSNSGDAPWHNNSPSEWESAYWDPNRPSANRSNGSDPAGHDNMFMGHDHHELVHGEAEAQERLLRKNGQYRAFESELLGY